MGSLTRESFLRVRIRAKQSAMDIAVIRCRSQTVRGSKKEATDRGDLFSAYFQRKSRSRRTHHLHDGSFGVAQGCRPGDEGKAAPGPAHLMQKRALIAMQYSALHNRTWITPTVQKPCRNRAKTVQKPCTHGLQNKKAMKSFDFTAFSGAMEGTRTPGLLIRSQSLYPAELPTHTFRSEHDVFYHEGRGLSTAFLKYFYIFQKRTSFL